MLDSLIPERSATDVLAGRSRVTLGGEAYSLPALTIEQSEAWLAEVDGELAGLLGGLDAAGNDLPAILALLTGTPERLLGFLYAYDVHHVLPERDALRAKATKAELLSAVLEVWRTENPLVGLALAGMTAGLFASVSSVPTSSAPPPTAGRRRRSAGH